MVSERFHRMAALYDDRIAVVDGSQRITWGDLARRKASIALYLRSQLHLSAGDVVAAFLPNCWECIAGFLAAAEIGAVWMPVNTEWRGSEIEWLTSRVPVSSVLTFAELREPWLGLGDRLPPGRVVSVDEVVPREAEHPSRAERFTDHPLMYYITSGSTGRPRVVPRSHRNMVAAMDSVGGALGIEPHMRFLGAVPFSHATGFGNCILLALLHGAAVVVMRKFHPRTLTDVVRHEEIEVINGSPFIFRTLADSISDAEAFRSVRICTSAGAPMPAAVTRQCRERLGLDVRQLYGSSEAGTVSIEGGGSLGVEGAAGRPLPHVQVRILRPDGSQAPPGEPGEVAVRSPAMTSGYLGEPELNQRAFIDGFFRTGDLGKLDADGNLFITGRLKKVINVAGVKIDPAEIEGVLNTMPEVSECRVSGISSSGETEIIAAQIAVWPGMELSRAGVLEYLRANLAEYKIPRIIEIMDALPVAVSGKTPAPWSRADI